MPVEIRNETEVVAIGTTALDAPRVDGRGAEGKTHTISASLPGRGTEQIAR